MGRGAASTNRSPVTDTTQLEIVRAHAQAIQEAIARLSAEVAEHPSSASPVVPPSDMPGDMPGDMLASLLNRRPGSMPLTGNLWWASVSKDRYAYRESGTHWYIRRNEFVPGEWLEIEGYLEFCSNGIHVSRTVLERWAYASENYLALVEVDPTNDFDSRDDRSVYRRGRILRIWERSQFFQAVQEEYAALPEIDRRTTHYGMPCGDPDCTACLRELCSRFSGLESRIERRLLAMPPVVSVPF